MIRFKVTIPEEEILEIISNNNQFIVADAQGWKYGFEQIRFQIESIFSKTNCDFCMLKSAKSIDGVENGFGLLAKTELRGVTLAKEFISNSAIFTFKTEGDAVYFKLEYSDRFEITEED